MTVDGDGLDVLGGVSAGTVRIVQYILKLKLPPARWERVAEIIEAAIAAAAADDLEGLRRATDDLTLVGPVRIIKVDGVPAESAGQKIFERANVLIYALQPMQPTSAESKNAERH